MKKKIIAVVLAVGMLLFNRNVFAGISLDAIKKSEEAAKARGERTWEEMESSYSSGQYKVGTDIPAGEYILFAGGETGYFCVSSDSNADNILLNDNFEYNSIITVQDGEYLELTRCYAVGMSDNLDIDTSGTGMFKVGTHIPAGEYKLEAGNEKGYYCIYSDSRHGDIIANNNFDGQTYVTVSDGQYLQLVRCCFAERPVTETVNINFDIETGIPQPLGRDDFLVDIENDVDGMGKYDNDVLMFLNQECSEGGYYCLFNYLDGYEVNPEKDTGEVTIYRGITLGKSTKEDLINAYGLGIEYEFDKDTDLIYNASVHNGDLNGTAILGEYSTEVIFYNYKDLGQIIFFIKEDGIIEAIAYTNITIYQADAETIKEAQIVLTEKGYDCGAPDGIIGSNTRNAILNFQKDNQLFESGIVDDQLLKTLGEDNIENKDTNSNTISITMFVERYNEGIDYYNAIAERDGYNTANYITEELAQGSDNFSPDGELSLCVNPNTTYKSEIGIINAWSENKDSLDANVATGEIMAMLYAFDRSLNDGAEALDLWSELNENSTINKNGISYDNYSFGNMVALKAQYDGFDITK